MENVNLNVLPEAPVSPANPRRTKAEWVTLALKAGAILCVIASLLLVFFADWFSLGGIPNRARRELNAIRKDIKDDAKINALYASHWTIDYITTDMGFVTSKKDMRNFFDKTDSVLQTVLSCKWSLADFVGISEFAQDVARRYEESNHEEIYDMLYRRYFYEWDFQQSDLDDAAEMAGPAIKAVHIGLIALLVVLGVAGVGAIASVFVKKLSAFRYIFAIVLVVLLIVAIVGTAVANGLLPELADWLAEYLGVDIEAISLAITAAPVLCALFACGSVALTIVADEKAKEKA